MADLYEYAKRCQMPRNAVINLLSDLPTLSSIVPGSFVRVLLELNDSREDYILARIDGIEHSDAYSGFSQQASQETTVHLRLQLPARLSTINGLLYQLNSISNSPMTPEEYRGWTEMVQSEFPLPTAAELEAIAGRVRNFNSRRLNTAAVVVPAPAEAAPLANQESVALGQTSHQGGAPPAAAVRPPVERKPAYQEEDGLPSRTQVHHLVFNELRDQHAMFPTNVEEMKTTALRLAERDLVEYLENVRDAILSKRSTCVVCMDHVVSVIMLPCKHKVLCRLCASSVHNCPVCREMAVEMFEPVEI